MNEKKKRNIKGRFKFIMQVCAEALWEEEDDEEEEGQKCEKIRECIKK